MGRRRLTDAEKAERKKERGRLKEKEQAKTRENIQKMFDDGQLTPREPLTVRGTGPSKAEMEVRLAESARVQAVNRHRRFPHFYTETGELLEQPKPPRSEEPEEDEWAIRIANPQAPGYRNIFAKVTKAPTAAALSVVQANGNHEYIPATTLQRNESPAAVSKPQSPKQYVVADSTGDGTQYLTTNEADAQPNHPEMRSTQPHCLPSTAQLKPLQDETTYHMDVAELPDSQSSTVDNGLAVCNEHVKARTFGTAIPFTRIPWSSSKCSVRLVNETESSIGRVSTVSRFSNHNLQSTLHSWSLGTRLQAICQRRTDAVFEKQMS